MLRLWLTQKHGHVIPDKTEVEKKMKKEQPNNELEICFLICKLAFWVIFNHYFQSSELNKLQKYLFSSFCWGKKKLYESILPPLM